MADEPRIPRLIRIARALRLRCPQCGKGKLFYNWFFMPKQCSNCGLIFNREPGYYLGSVYVNYGLTALLVTAANLILVLRYGMDANAVMYCSLAFAVLFPVLFFPFARALWLAFDLSWDPPDETSFKDQENESME